MLHFNNSIEIRAWYCTLLMNSIDYCFSSSIYWHFFFLRHEKAHSVFFGRSRLLLCVYCSCLGEILTPIIKSNTITLTVCINNGFFFFFNPVWLQVNTNTHAFEIELHSLSTFQVSISKIITMPNKTLATRSCSTLFHKSFGNLIAVLQ